MPIQGVEDVISLLSTAAGDLLSLKPSAQRARALAYLSGTILKALEVGTLADRVAALEELQQHATVRGGSS